MKTFDFKPTHPDHKCIRIVSAVLALYFVVSTLGRTGSHWDAIGSAALFCLIRSLGFHSAFNKE